MAADASLKPHWFYILLALADGDRHGLAIARDVQALSDGAVSALARDALRLPRGAAGPALDRRGQRASPGESERRRYYRLTRAGRHVLTDEAEPARTPRASRPGARPHRRGQVNRAYRGLLAIAPRDLRAIHGPEMEELFAERLAAARRRGGAAVVAVWTRALGDVAQARIASFRSPRVPLTIPIDERTSLMAGSDVRYAWRSLLRQRGATALVILMLALGIAANVAVFSLVNGLFLRPFPFPHPERLVYVNTAAPKWNLDVVGINYPDFDRWRKDQKLFEALTTYRTADFISPTPAAPSIVRGAQMTYDFPRVLRSSQLLGRSFTRRGSAERRTGRGHQRRALWKERFGADPNVIGRTLRLGGTVRTIIGVMPPEASFPTTSGYGFRWPAM
jgi:DNA-binding PadR family transcriptional regulator